MKLLITGAYGLVGSTMCRQLAAFHPEVEITKVKFDRIPLDGEYDMIIHGAGYGQPLRFTEDKIRTIRINTDTTERLFGYLKEGGKFLFISTSEVYSGAIPPYQEDTLGTTTPEHPRACYIEGKRCGEAICIAYKEQGFDVKIARLALAYGPANLGDTRVLNQFIEQGLTGEIRLMDSGTAVRTYCYVEDAVELMWKILTQGKGTVYNVGGFSTVTIAELAQEIGRIMGAKVVIPDAGTALGGSPQNVMLDMTRTLREFDQRFTTLDKGLRKTISQYKHGK